MIKHIVMWKICESDIPKIQEKFELMIDKIPQIMKLETGINIKSNNTNRDFILITYHKNKEDLDNYQTHPYHIEVAKFVSQHDVSERVCVDFESNEI